MEIITANGTKKQKKKKMSVGLYLKKVIGLVHHASSTKCNKKAAEKKKICCFFLSIRTRNKLISEDNNII
jgi:hypothetical protein